MLLACGAGGARSPFPSQATGRPRRTRREHDMSTPFAFYGEPGELGLPAPWAARAASRDARERRERAERRARAEDRHDRVMWNLMQRAHAEGRQVNPADPSTFVPTPDELAARVFGAQDRAAARHLRTVPPQKMPPPQPEPGVELQPAPAQRNREAGYVRLRIARFFRDL